ncbi:nickel-dependent hydrogenase large subunit [Patescibacteria group bacterium]|nr:nickel-dependent hydrogenase large subunit [Patescibacteria group bacterium]
MHSGNITIENITKIEGSAGLEVTIENGKVTDLKFKINDYRRFYTKAVKGKPFISSPSFLSRICGTCSVAHLFASIKAVEQSQGIEITEQTRKLRRLAYDALMIRDHALHLYFFVLPDLLGVDSILDIPDNHDDIGHTLLHDSFDIKQLGTDIADIIIGAAIHAPFPTIGGFLKLPDESKFPELLERLEKIRPQVLRGIKAFYDYDAQLIRDSDYVAIRGKNGFDFLEGDLISMHGKKIPENEFLNFFDITVVPYSQSEGYVFSDDHKNYLVGSLARLNINKDQLHTETQKDAEKFLSVFPSENVYHNNLAQAIEILHCVDEAIDILKDLKIVDEKPVKTPLQAGTGIGVVEAPRGTLYHKAVVDEKGMIVDHDVIVPTSQNQISIENDLKKYFNENLDKSEEKLKLDAESIIRAYDPCMSCATNFLKIDWIRK